MGAWGTGVYDDDAALEVRDDFFFELSKGITVSEIERHIDFDYTDGDNETDTVVVLALACAELETATLTESTKKRALEVIDSNINLGLWPSDSADSDHIERKKELKEIRRLLMSYNGTKVSRSAWENLQQFEDLNDPIPVAFNELRVKPAVMQDRMQKRVQVIGSSITIIVVLALLLSYLVTR